MTDPKSQEFKPCPEQIKLAFASYGPVIKLQLTQAGCPGYVKEGLEGFVSSIERWIKETEEATKND